MIHVHARISARKGRGADLLAAFKELLPQVHAEDGCVQYVPAVDLDAGLDRFEPAAADVVTIVEKWVSVDHLKAHLTAAHMLAFREKIGDLVEGAELRILEER